LYGGMVWGILPVQTDISWESHLYGAMAGLLLAFIYRGQNPHQEEEGEEEESEGEQGEAGEEKEEEDDTE